MPSVNESQQSSAFVATRANAERHARFLALAVLIGIALYVLLDIIVQVLPPHYSALSQPESDLAVGPFGFLMAINFVIRGLVALALVWALVKHLPGEALSCGGLFLCSCNARSSLSLIDDPSFSSHPYYNGKITVRDYLLTSSLSFVLPESNSHL